MEAGLSEIQNLMPDDMSLGRSRSNTDEPNDVAQLRALLREKNEKIAMLTAEFDNHRADFRSTIDTLELASSETERVYEKKVEELQSEIRELHDRAEDVESVAIQLKQLEELVQELEEGLEDARRGEAEARGEVEFLRGEVERGRSELRREREKAAAALKGAGAMVDAPVSPGSREVEQRDDEIRGLKAIIHSLSSGPEEHGRSPMHRQGSFVDPELLRAAQSDVHRLERDKEELRGLVERKAFRIRATGECHQQQHVRTNCYSRAAV
jgi:chromosome segregation ATPase